MNIVTPVGRLIQGDCFKFQDKDRSGNPLLVKSGPNAGQPRVNYFMGLAISKTDPGVETLRAQIHEVARQGHPTLFDAAGNCVNPKFAFKYTDGDSTEMNESGKRWCDLPNYPGNYVFKFSSGYAPKCYTENCAAPITDPAQLKRGYYIRIVGSVEINADKMKPGVFLNHGLVELIGYGPEIQSGPDAKAAFGAVPVTYRPPGMSATPVAAAPGGAPPMQATPSPAATPAPAAVVQPATDFLNPPAGVPAPVTAPMPVEERYKDSAGNVFTRSQLSAAGYTDAIIATLTRV